ncbi:hypothetical protein BDZ89DRAFT_1061854 [Hymenopellis radicata]|nr:hypothetical protein BDZ89DRAFT_1061854 [Hymenopellis radicata]
MKTRWIPSLFLVVRFSKQRTLPRVNNLRIHNQCQIIKRLHMRRVMSPQVRCVPHL